MKASSVKWRLTETYRHTMSIRHPLPQSACSCTAAASISVVPTIDRPHMNQPTCRPPAMLSMLACTNCHCFAYSSEWTCQLNGATRWCLHVLQHSHVNKNIIRNTAPLSALSCVDNVIVSSLIVILIIQLAYCVLSAANLSIL